MLHDLEAEHADVTYVRPLRGSNTEGGFTMRLGFIGTGNMGLPICRNLLAQGHGLTIYARRPHTASELLTLGATLVSDPAGVAQASDVVFTCLPGPGEVREVALGDKGIRAGLHKGMTYIDMTTNAPSLVREI